MKKIVFLLSVLLCISCEEVVHVDLQTAAPRLVIDAAIDWEKGTPGNEQVIKLTTSTGYYNTVIPTVSGATVTVVNSSNTIFNFIETVPNSGEYKCFDFVPVLDETYTLIVTYNGQTYRASEKMTAVPDITAIQQRNDVGFSGSDIEVKFLFNDDGTQDNYYLDKYVLPTSAFPLYDVFDDTFTQGNESFSVLIDEDLKSGDIIDFTLFGISETYANYMSILIGQTGTNNGGPFQTPPATVRGNIVNQTNFNNYCFGYFRCAQLVNISYTVE
jgi:hypothetical protein